MSQWYYNDAGQQRGPLPEEEMKSLLESGRIHSETFVWTEGMPDWKAASAIDALRKPADATDKSLVSPYAPPAAEPAATINWSGYEPSGPQIRPWVRYWARSFDFLLFSLIVGASVVVIWPEVGEMNDTFLGIILLLIYNFVEPILLAITGTTPFKALLGVRVRNHDGTKLSYLQGLRRMFSIWVRGQGLGIPLITLITGISSYNRLSNHGVTGWDQEGGFTVTHRTLAWWRWLILIGLFVGFVSLIVLGSEM